MKSLNSGLVRKICLFTGVALLAAGIAVLVFWQWGLYSSREKAKHYTQALLEIIPQPVSAIPEERRDNAMPTLSVEEVDFVGIIEMPRYDSILPVCANWGKTSKYPCRLEGSVYDKSIQIGATSQKGQYDFYRDISVGDTVFFRDTEGNRYEYSVTDIRYEKNADQESLHHCDSALTLFIKNTYAFEYVVVYCNIAD